ncbi:MAG: hypothetical protein PHF63_10355 [Herbinix sp.]|nr:hypothetical protein [Herbinix sp.]
MLNNKKMRFFTITDIIERSIQFTKNNKIFDKAEFKDVNEGELLAYEEMLVDVQNMSESEFLNKYLKIVRGLEQQFENREISDEKEIEKVSGYNNAIIFILKCIKPVYEYTLCGDD